MVKGKVELQDEQTLERLGVLAKNNNVIDQEFYTKYDVKQGLRGNDGMGVLVGLTEIGEVHSYIIDENEMIPVPGRLLYRGFDIASLCDGFIQEDRFGFEETCYLLLFGKLPEKDQLDEFRTLMAKYRSLPPGFTRDSIMKIPGKNMMNVLARSILALYAYDENPDDTSAENVMRQCLQLISYLPVLAIHGYHAFTHYYKDDSLVIHSPRPDLSTAENILHMLRADKHYTKLEAVLLDLALVLHAEHGGGNNSTFITHVSTSTGTDTYSVMAAAIGSLKGPRHGGANIKVVEMFDDIKQNISDWDNDKELQEYLMKILKKEAFDGSGLIYGIGHAVYSVSDPRAVIFKEYIKKLAKEKGMENEFRLYESVERLAPKAIAEVRKVHKGVSANVDFYSGFVYKMLDIPEELFTSIFAIARIVGWSAHRIEEIMNDGKIIRPAYKSVASRKEYIPLDERL